MSTELVDSIKSLIENGKGDSGRLGYIIEVIKQGKKFYDSDRKYVGSLLETISNQSETISILNEIKSIHNQIESIQNHIKSDEIKSNRNQIKSIQNQIKSYQIKSNQNEIKLPNIEEDYNSLSYHPADQGEISKILDIIQLQNDDDPLTILKKRLAKGEISKEEYQDLKSAF